jgi:hypothetical protein
VLSFILSLVAIVLSFFTAYHITYMQQDKVMETLSSYKWVGGLLTAAVASIIGLIVAALLALVFISKSLNYGPSFELLATVISVAGALILGIYLVKSPRSSSTRQGNSISSEDKVLLNVASNRVSAAAHAAFAAARLHAKFFKLPSIPPSALGVWKTTLQRIMEEAAAQVVEDAADALMKAMAQYFVCLSKFTASPA